MAEDPTAYFTREHGWIEGLMGRLLGGVSSGVAEAARLAVVELDEAIRRHTADEEKRIIPAAASGKLVATEGETDRERLARELRLEHVQIREVVGMMRRLIEERGDLPGAKALFGGLAKRWDAHVEKEVRELTRERSDESS